LSATRSIVLAVASALVLALCPVLSTGATAQPNVVGPPGLPGTGALFGAYIQPDCTWSGCDRVSAQAAVEGTNQANRQMAVDRQFYLWTDDWPTADDAASAAAGRMLLLSWDPTLPTGKGLQWADIANGLYDSAIDAQAAKVKAFPYSFWFAFHHEPQNQPPGGGSYGTPAGFIAAYRHVHDRFIADGVTNVRWTVILFASTYKNGKGDLYYPGDQYVDAIAADGYNWYLCGGPWETFKQVFQAFYGFGLSHQKTMIIAEWGTGEDPAIPSRKGQWFTDALAQLKLWPEIHMIAYYDTGKNPQCLRWINTPVANDPNGLSVTAFRQIGADPYFNPAPDQTPPVASFTATPPKQSSSSTATFSWTASEFDVRYVCSLDGAPLTPCYDFTLTSTGLANGSHSFKLRPTDYSGNVGALLTYTWTVNTATVPITITDAAFSPQAASASQGQTVVWTNTGANTHQVVDTSGMGLFASGSLTSGQTYSFAFVCAGTYAYNDPLFPTMTGTVAVPMFSVPTSGGTTTVFTLTWAASTPPAGFVYDVQIKRPTGNWTTWRSGQTVTTLTWTPDAGTGSYQFRARIKQSATGKFSGWSAPITIVIS
jgi:plastocyanin